MLRLQEIGWDDWWAFAMRFGSEISRQAYLFVIVFVLAALLYAIFKPRNKTKRYLFSVTLSLLIAALVAYFGFAAHRILVLTLLGSEDDALAENAYQNFSQHTQQHILIKIINDTHEDENVRFYAACALADELVINGRSENLLQKDLQNAPDIHPRFFNQNGINSIVFPSIVSISPMDVVSKRLEAEETQHHIERQ